MLNLQWCNISYLGKRKSIFKSASVGDLLVPRRVGRGVCGVLKGVVWRQEKHFFCLNKATSHGDE